MKRKSVLWTWSCSYIIVLCIPLILVFVNFRLNINTMKRELKGAKELVLDNVKDGIDRYVGMLKQYYLYVFLADDFGLIQYSGDKDLHFYNNTLHLQEQLYHYRNGVEEMFCMIYIEDKDYVVSSQNSCSAEQFYSGMKYTYKDFIGYDDWKKVLTGDYEGDFLVESGLNYWTGEQSLVYADTITNQMQEKYNVFVSIPLSQIGTLTEYLEEGSRIRINIKGQETLEFCGGKLVPKDEAAIEDSIKLFLDSAFNEITYELLVSEESMFEKLGDVRRTFWSGLIVTSFLGVAGIGILLIINYRPVYYILNEIEEKAEIVGEGNEFQKLKESYIRLKREKNTSQILVKKQKEQLMNTWLLMLMKGRTIKQQEKEEKKFWDFNLKNSVALVGFIVPVTVYDVEYGELNFFILDNIFSELMQNSKFYHIEDGNFVFYLFDLKQGMEEEWRKDACEKATYVCTLLREKWDIPVVGAISDIGSGIDTVKSLYQNVMNAFEYGKVVGAQGVIDVRNMPNYDEFDLLKDYMHKEFRSAFTSGDVNSAYAVLEKVFESRSTVAKNIAIIKVHVYEAFIILMDIFREHVTDVVQQEHAISYLELLIKENSVEGIKEHFCDLLKFQMDAVSKQQLLENKGIVIKVMKYVEANYTDCNLNLSSMAEDLKKNSRYISRVFKEEKQMGILDYINSIRIMKAKELMASREYTIEEVARQVGYGNVRTFRRAFTKITGEVPSVYIER